MKKQKFNATIIIGDPCMMVKSEEDWETCDYGEQMDKLGFKNYLSVEFDEDAPDVVDDKGNVLGSFCTDSSMILVVPFDDLMKYNPDFNVHIEYPHSCTIIENFCGEVTYNTRNDTTTIVGKGNANFKSVAEE